MSDQYQQGQRPVQQQSESAPTEWLGSDQPPHEPYAAGPAEGGGGGRKRWIVPVAAVAAVVLIGGGAFGAYTVLSGGGAQPAEAIPASALAYGRVDIDPSAEQKVNALQLLRRVPEFEEETGISSDTDDLRRRLFEEAVSEEEGCSDVDYGDDVEPWLGDRAGFAVMPPTEEGGEPQPLLVVQVTDQDAAETGIEALIECGEATGAEDQPLGIDFVGDYAVMAEAELVEGYAADAEESPLSEDESFTADMEALEGEGLVSGWLDLDALVDALGEQSPEVTEVLAALDIEALGSVSMAMRAQSDALELVYAGDSDALSLLNPSGSSTEPASDVPGLPDTTMFAAGFTGGGETIDELWSKLLELEQSGAGDGFAPGTLQMFAADVEAASGFVVPDDLSVLLGEQFTFAVDGEGFDFVGDDGQPDFSGLNLGMLMRTDADAASDLVTRANEALAGQGAPFELAQEEVDGGLVVAANDDYAGTLAEGGSLGDTDAYQSAVADGDDAVGVVYLDFDRVSDVVAQVSEDVGEDVPAQATETLDVLRAFGASTVVDGDHTRTTMRLVFD